MDVAAAFKNFFAGFKSGKKRGYPTFKTKRKSKPAFYLANDRFTVGDHWVEISKLGRVNLTEKLRFSGKILCARVSKTASWWFISITVELPDEAIHNTRPPIGLDAGLNRLATLSDGRQFENQKPLRTLLKRLRAANKQLARCQKGSANWCKAKKKLARLHYRIACIRDDLLHKLTTEIATTAGVVGIESLHVKGLIQLSDRSFVCQHPDCLWSGDRDYNAAVNILNEALRLIGVALSGEVVPVVATTAPKTASGLGVRPKRR